MQVTESKLLDCSEHYYILWETSYLTNEAKLDQFHGQLLYILI